MHEIREATPVQVVEPSPGRVLAVTCAAATACVLPPFLIGAMAVQIRADLGFSEGGTGLAVGAFFAAASGSSFLMGRRAERLGAERSLGLAAIWTAVAQLAIAIGAHSLIGLCLLLAVAGSANAFGQPAANLLIAQAMPVHRLGFAYGAKQAAVPFATLVGGLAVPAVALTAGWRWAFVGSAALSAVCALVVATIRTRRLRAGPPPVPQAGRAPWQAMTLLSIGMGFGAAAAGTLGGFLVSAGVEVGLSPGTAGLTLTAGSAFGILMRLVVGARADRRGSGHLGTVTAMLAMGSVGFLGFAAGTQGLFLAGIPLAFGAGWAWPGLLNLAIVQANPGSPAAATGIIQTGTYFGAVAGPLGFGFAAEHASYDIAWMLAGGFCLLSAGLVTAGGGVLRRVGGV